ncbi:MAG: hypothetical protein ACOYB1_18445 [Limnohabitans sp.]
MPGRAPEEATDLRNSLLANKIITCNYCGKMQCVVTPYAVTDKIIEYFGDNGRAPENDIDYRLDAGPPLAPGAVIIPLLSLPLEKVVEFIKRLFRR